MSNLDRYKADLTRVNVVGRRLLKAMRFRCDPDGYTEKAIELYKDKADEHLDGLPSFKRDYQKWYSECLVLVKQVIPDRLDDFIYLYAKPKTRKEVVYGNYTIADFLDGLVVMRGSATVVGMDAAISNMEQQIAIVDSATERFNSSLYDIQAMVQADLLDSEIDAARLLAKYKFYRAAGAIAGVVIEKHLALVCKSHDIKVVKKNPTIGDFNELLKAADVINVAQWRFIQHLTDIRNMCDHGRDEPGMNEATDILDGTSKIIKTIF